MTNTEATKAGDLHKLARFVSAVFADSSFALDVDSHPEAKELAIELGIADEVLQNRFVEDDEADVAYTLAQWVPRECERLQGAPDDYTLVPRGKAGKLMADSPRYKMLGNSFAVPVVRWIGAQIARAHAESAAAMERAA
jgi:site-specific DNA-cytosine methylase